MKVYVWAGKPYYAFCLIFGSMEKDCRHYVFWFGGYGLWNFRFMRQWFDGKLWFADMEWGT